MATDDKNNDPEQDDFFGDDDDDFGLPELEYEALDDDDSDSEIEDVSSDEDELLIEEDTSDVFGSDVEMNDDDMSDDFGDTDDFDDSEDMDDVEDISDDLDAAEDISDDFDDGEDIPDQISDEELEESMDDEISDEELNEFYEEESFDDFESSDSGAVDAEMTDSVFDSGGMDDDEFKQFEQNMASSGSDNDFNESASSYSSRDGQESKGKFTRLVIIGVVIFVVLGFSSLLIYQNFASGDEKPVAEKVVKKPEVKKPIAKPIEKKEEPKEDSKPAQVTPKKPKPNTSTPGTINALSEKTGNTHVIIASFLDEDMAVDYANDLASAGKSPSLIPPFGNAKTTRVAISSYPSLADAQVDLENFKSEYGPNVWLLKY